MVTGVETVTWPACNWNCSQAVFGGMVTVAGTGAAAGFELVMLMVAPLAPTAALNCTWTKVVLPEASGLVVNVIPTGTGGVPGIVNVPAADHAVTAAVVGEESPWADRTRQNLVPGLSEST